MNTVLEDGFQGELWKAQRTLMKTGIGSARRFARRLYIPRIIGLATGFFCVSSVLVMQPVSGWWWLLLVAYGFIWPHFAWQTADRASTRRAEIRNLMVDSLMGGVWIAVMGLNALPSALILAILCMNNVGCGGLKLFLGGLGVIVLSCLLTLGLSQIPLNLQTMPSQVWICLPLLLIYRLTLAWLVTELLSNSPNINGV